MQKLEQRVNSARSKLPAPTSTPPRASPRSGSALGQSYIPATVTVRSSKRRTGGSNASLSLQSPSVSGEPFERPSSRLSFGFSQPTASPVRDQNPSRPSSRASISSRASLTHLPTATPSSRPSSRQSVSGARTPLGHYATSTQSESRRPRSSIGGSYAATHGHGGHGHSASFKRLSYHGSDNPQQQVRDEEDEAADVLTPTPSRRTTFGKDSGAVGSGIPTPGKRSNVGVDAGVGVRVGVGVGGKRISSGPGDMGPPAEKRAASGRKLSGVGESY